MSSFKQGLKLVTAILVLSALTRCGANLNSDGGAPQATACSPNVIDSGLQLKVESMGSSTYKFTLCADSQPSTAAYTVYGGLRESDVSQGSIDVQAARRLPHIRSSNSAGSVFQVTFQNSDTYFAIYQDVDSSFSSNWSMVTPHRIPGR